MTALDAATLQRIGELAVEAYLAGAAHSATVFGTPERQAAYEAAADATAYVQHVIVHALQGHPVPQ
jgi:hypothetical protein